MKKGYTLQRRQGSSDVDIFLAVSFVGYFCHWNLDGFRFGRDISNAARHDDERKSSV